MPLINAAPYRLPPLSGTQPVLLMHMEGSSIVDSTGRHTFTNNGGANLNTSQKVFGTQSLQLTGNSVQLPVTTPNHDDFDLGSQDWTIELAVYPTVAATGQVLGTWRTGAAYSWAIISSSSGYFGLCYSVSGAYESANERGSYNVAPINTWTRIAFVRSDAALRMYVNGTYVPFAFGGNNIGSGTKIFKSLGAFAIGGNIDNQRFTGFIDEVRITKGTALYTGASYTLATEAFPNP